MMSPVLMVLFVGIVLFIFQSFFFLSGIKWLRREKIKKDKEFAILDSERAMLIEMQTELKEQIISAKKLSGETLNKLMVIGTEAHAEWEDVTKKIDNVLVEVDKHSSIILEENISKLTMRCLALEKLIKDAAVLNENLLMTTKKAQRVLKLFDASVPTEEIFKELQTEKYAEAKKMLADGIEASVVGKKLGLSMGEVMLISSYF